jgi:GAF domain-containing protein
MDALSGDPVPDLPTSKPADERYLRPEGIEHEIVSDIEARTDQDTGCQRMSRLLQVRSALRIPLSVEGGRVGALFFFARAANQYTEEDLVVARRVADHVSLALSHHRLLEEERAAAEARQRAMQLEERVAALKEESRPRGFRRVVGESRAWQEVLEHAARWPRFGPPCCYGASRARARRSWPASSTAAPHAPPGPSWA